MLVSSARKVSNDNPKELRFFRIGPLAAKAIR